MVSEKEKVEKKDKPEEEGREARKEKMEVPEEGLEGEVESRESVEKLEEKPIEFRHRVRLAGVIVDGNLDLVRALMKIKGIGHRIASTVPVLMDMPRKKRVGELSEEEIDRIENTLKNLHKKLPPWMLNREKDFETGKNLHLIGGDLEVTQREDITRQKRIKSYRGIRHSLGLPVRGQRTRTSFRTGATVGVTRRKR